ncbi:MAG: SWIM zinc finger family protein [Erysipelotrichaceae bacterium]|nr:SWIM zinc finger family protein [Erysipelotrichaceae bacterium]
MGYYNYYPTYVTVDELREKNRKKKKTYLKKHQDARPIIQEGTLGKTWWGKSWNKNLERYADYDNRLGRGKKYVKAEAIFDFHIVEGHIYGVVSGSGRKLYNVDIRIDPLKNEDWLNMQKAAGQQIDSLEELVSGKFPKNLKDIFFQENTGLFPTPKQIHFNCDCPDWAILCKHAAAVLYATSIALDDNPKLFFDLRGIQMDDLISKALGENVNQLIEKSQQKSNRILENEDLEALFHI